MADPIVTAAQTDAKAAEAAATAEVTKGVSFFEKNPKATAIGAAIAGALLAIAAIHFI